MAGSLRKKHLIFIVIVALAALTVTFQIYKLSPTLHRISEVDYFEDPPADKDSFETLNSHGLLDAQHPVWSSSYHTKLANNTIRKWGCQRNETPTFFVHIGKAGGGQVRARFAASALNYGRAKWHLPGSDEHFYPVSSEHNGSFCTSWASNMEFPLPGRPLKSYEGTYACAATTPIASALACPDPKIVKKRCWGCQDLNSPHCHTVYAGHNLLGHEMNFLPGRYLADWWNTTPWGEQFKVNWKVLRTGNKQWCEQHKLSRPLTKGAYRRNYQKCQKPIAEHLDEKFEAYWTSTTRKGDTPGRPMFDYAPLYASLPVQRVTVVREPFSWLMSKFSWHSSKNQNRTCDDITTAVSPPPNTGWVYEYCMTYILYLCGQDCYIRLDRGLMTLEELEVQATMNLRQSFSVVGLLNESDVFYDMVSARIGYIDMSLNPNVAGRSHQSNKSPEIRRCIKAFSNKDFQANLTKQLPVLGVLQRLYEVAVEVNRFQRQELRGCSASKLL